MVLAQQQDNTTTMTQLAQVGQPLKKWLQDIVTHVSCEGQLAAVVATVPGVSGPGLCCSCWVDPIDYYTCFHLSKQTHLNTNAIRHIKTTFIKSCPCKTSSCLKVDRIIRYSIIIQQVNDSWYSNWLFKILLDTLKIKVLHFNCPTRVNLFALRVEYIVWSLSLKHDNYQKLYYWVTHPYFTISAIS